MSDEESSQSSPRMHLHEWIAVVMLSGLIFVLAGISFYSGTNVHFPNVENPHHLVSPEIDVFIEGEVQHPGRHRVKRGALVGDLLNLAIPTSEAETSQLKLDKKLRKNQTVKVPKKGEKKPRKKKALKRA